MDSQTKELGNIDRHCAFCHELIPAKEVKCCSKCHRRAYCSRECQSADWTPKSNQKTPKKGQGHKNWCGLLSGEEDLDWEVGFVVKYKKNPGERGIIAKHFIPKNFRIMIDGFGGVGKKDEDGGSFADIHRAHKETIGRSYFSNHACDANAVKWQDPTFNAMVVLAKRDIQEGEEICNNYTCFNETYTILPFDPIKDSSLSWNALSPKTNQKKKFVMSFADCRKLLKTKYFVECPPDCFCYNSAAVEKILVKSKEMYELFMLWNPGTEITIVETEIFLKFVSLIMENHEKIHGNHMQKALLFEKAFHLAVQRTSTLDLAKEYIKEAYEIFSSVYHPESLLPSRVKKLMEEPHTAPSYLSLDSKTYEDEKAAAAANEPWIRDLYEDEISKLIGKGDFQKMSPEDLKKILNSET